MEQVQCSTWYRLMSLTRSKDTEQSVQKRVQSSPSIASLRPYLRAARRTGSKEPREFSLMRMWCYRSLVLYGMWKRTIPVWSISFRTVLLMRLKRAMLISTVYTGHWISSKQFNIAVFDHIKDRPSPHTRTGVTETCTWRVKNNAAAHKTE